MRIVGGLYKSRVLAAFDGEKIRPTADKVRESLFNILRNRVYGCKFLDLFCGTGAMGIEALSRGAALVTLNDASKDSLAVVRKNLALLKIEKGVEVTNYDYSVALSNAKTKYDIIFIDPPYASGLGAKALSLACASLNEGGVAIFEDEKPFVGEVVGLKKTDERKYGRVYLTFFEKEDL